MWCSSRHARGTAYVYATCGIVWWKAVSKTITCGRSGNSLRATAMPSRLAGLCSGASGTSSSTAATTSSSTSVGLDEPLAAVHHPVPDRDHLDVPELRAVVVERVDDRAQRVLERRELPLLGVLLAVDLVRQSPAATPRSARRTPTRATLPVSPSTRLYFSDDEPALTTST